MTLWIIIWKKALDTYSGLQLTFLVSFGMTGFAVSTPSEGSKFFS